MTVVVAGAGAAAFGLFVLAGLLRIGDIATTDGTTRTSINAAYQVVLAEERLAVQTVVEGIGVPIAIGVTGALLLALNLLDLVTGAVIVFGLVLGVIWTVIAFGVHRSAWTRSPARYPRPRPRRLRHNASTMVGAVTAAPTTTRCASRSRPARRCRLAGIRGRAGTWPTTQTPSCVYAHSSNSPRTETSGQPSTSGRSSSTSRARPTRPTGALPPGRSAEPSRCRPRPARHAPRRCRLYEAAARCRDSWRW